MSENYTSYDDVSTRLNEILDEVNAEGVSLDEALALYEEAVQLGLRACDLSEEGAEALLAAEEATATEADGAEDAGDASVAGADTVDAAGAVATDKAAAAGAVATDAATAATADTDSADN